jgi:hypothetical protein
MLAPRALRGRAGAGAAAGAPPAAAAARPPPRLVAMAATSPARRARRDAGAASAPAIKPRQAQGKGTPRRAAPAAPPPEPPLSKEERARRSLTGVAAAAAARWPRWAANGFHLWRDEAGVPLAASEAPVPDEAAAALGALWVDAGARPRTLAARSRAVAGLVEALALTPPRGAPEGGAAESLPPAPALSPEAFGPALCALAAVGLDTAFEPELAALAARLPAARFASAEGVWRAARALAAARLWSEDLPLLEARAAAAGPSAVDAAQAAAHLARLGHRPDALLELLGPALDAEWSWYAAERGAWAAAVADRLDAPAVGAALRGLRARCGGAGAPGARLEAWGQFLLTLRLRRPAARAALLADAPAPTCVFVAAAEAAWGSMPAGAVSAAARDVHAAALALGLPAQLEGSMGGLSVDVAVPEKGLAIEVDGPSHFFRNAPARRLGNALWKRRLLEGDGVALASVRTDAWLALRGPAEQRRFLAAAVAEARARVAGGAAAAEYNELRSL